MYRFGSGFTAVELLLVIVLLSVLAAAALPVFRPAPEAPRAELGTLAQAPAVAAAVPAAAGCIEPAVALAGSPVERPAPAAR